MMWLTFFGRKVTPGRPVRVRALSSRLGFEVLTLAQACPVGRGSQAKAETVG